MKIAMGNDHAAVEMKQEIQKYLEEIGYKEADYLLSEAFCLYGEREKFKPYEKHHSTALDAARVARELSAKNLILYHTQDNNLSARKALYTAEAKKEFSGAIYVPDDLESLEI